ncbi:MAG: AzlC family ABC transporter permease [Cocleimonas sp.]
MNQKTNLFLRGAGDIIPLLIAAIPFGIVYGALAQTNGLSVLATMGMSLFVFAGSSQFVAVTLIGVGAAVPIIVLTVFVVNLRHMLYAVSMMPYVSELPQKIRALMSFWLTDESYATLSKGLIDDPKMPQFHWYYFGGAFAMYFNWQCCTALGIYLGQEIPDLTKWGLDIAMVVAFVGIVVPILKNKAQWACAITAFFAALVTHSWPHQSGLLISSLIAIAVGVLLSQSEVEDSQNE